MAPCIYGLLRKVQCERPRDRKIDPSESQENTHYHVPEKSEKSRVGRVKPSNGPMSKTKQKYYHRILIWFYLSLSSLYLRYILIPPLTPYVSPAGQTRTTLFLSSISFFSSNQGSPHMKGMMRRLKPLGSPSIASCDRLLPLASPLPTPRDLLWFDFSVVLDMYIFGLIV